MKKILSLVFLSVLAVPFFLTASAGQPLARVEIPSMYKNIFLIPGEVHHFEAFGYFMDGQVKSDFVPSWKIIDMEGDETTIPGRIDQDGTFTATRFNWGPFKIVAFDPETSLFDEAEVTIGHQPDNRVYRIDVSPWSLQSGRGGLNRLWITCYNVQWQPIGCYLDVTVHDWYGGWRFDVAEMRHGSYLYVQPWAPLGDYRVHFQDAYGYASSEIQLHVRW
ncbi:MAG: hypothetical protein HYW47_05535 [Deltaproteobacteria bacterium]|nr:hypothetical protein [Deltaproteobacteria bacterium]